MPFPLHSPLSHKTFSASISYNSPATVLSSVLPGALAFTHVSVSAFVLATTSYSVLENVQTMPQPSRFRVFCQTSWPPPLPAWRLASGAATFTSVSVSQTLTAFTSASLSAIVLADVCPHRTECKQVFRPLNLLGCDPSYSEVLAPPLNPLFRYKLSAKCLLAPRAVPRP